MFNALYGDSFGGALEQGIHPLHQGPASPSDDSLLTLATARALLDGGNSEDFAERYRAVARARPKAGFGPRFLAWAHAPVPGTNDSLGNGCIMRASPLFWWARSTDEALALAQKSTAYSHRNPAATAATALYLLAGLTLRHRGEATLKTLLLRAGMNLMPPEKWHCTALAPQTVLLALTLRLSCSTEEQLEKRCLHVTGDQDTLCACAFGLWLQPLSGAKLAPLTKQLEPFSRVIPPFKAAVRLRDSLPLGPLPQVYDFKNLLNLLE